MGQRSSDRVPGTSHMVLNYKCWITKKKKKKCWRSMWLKLGWLNTITTELKAARENKTKTRVSPHSGYNLSKTNKSQVKFITAVQLKHKNQHYVKSTGGRWMEWKIEREGEGERLHVSCSSVAFIMCCIVLFPIKLVCDLLQVTTLINQSIRF